MSTDERRARAIMDAMDTYNIDEPIRHYLARAIRASDEAAGMVLVPRHPTRKMQEAAARLCDEDGNWPDDVTQLDIWRAMLAAATESDNG